MADSSTDLQTAADNPKSATSDGQSVTQHSLTERMEMDKYISSKDAAARSAFPIPLFKCKAPNGNGEA